MFPEELILVKQVYQDSVKFVLLPELATVEL